MDEPTAEPRPPSARRRPASLAPLGWALCGVGLTLLVVVALRWSERTTPTATASSLSTGSRSAHPASLPAPGSSREQFATLYLSYLLNTYYVPSRGFCQPLLRKVCLALHDADLLLDARDCDTVPNDELVLAIGRYQHRVGLPVDGKAGPETVRMMLGGDFANRRGMEETYCATPSSSADADSTSSARPRQAP
jgi:hypothetical protein